MSILLFELGKEGRKGDILPQRHLFRKEVNNLIPSKFIRKQQACLPQLSEPEVIRHYYKLALLNHHVDKGFYPLGSCTMKYNPKVNETLSRLIGLIDLHPLQCEGISQTALEIMHDLSNYLCEISGMAGVSLQPAAGAHGELTSLKIIRAFHESRGNVRVNVLIPDSAHGTNPASVAIAGYNSIKLNSNESGMIDLEDLKLKLNEKTAALMITNPNTLGIFEAQVGEIIELVHRAGALVYMDGANLNALLGLVRPGDIDFDILHFNLHKTFATPHGGGGPGSGPIGVSSQLLKYLPIPAIVKKEGKYSFEYDRPHSIGKISTFYGNFGVIVKAYIYIRMLGEKGLKRVSENAVINANYLMKQLEKYYLLPYKSPAMHEFVLSGENQKTKGVKTLDIAKRLLDFGFHAPTIYFPLIVKEAMMIEPTETESKETLDRFIAAMIQIAHEVETDPETVKKAPTTTVVSRLDEVKAIKQPDIKYDFTTV